MPDMEQTQGFYSSEVIHIGEDVKAVSDDGRYLTVGAYGVRFGNREECDLTGEWFAANTDYGPHSGNGMAAAFHHRRPVGDEPTCKAFAKQIFGPVKAVRDDTGIFVEHVLDMADEYQSIVARLVKMGKLRWSSGTAQHMIDRDQETGQIKTWHIIEWSYTPQAAEPRLPTIAPLKSLPVDPEVIQIMESLAIQPSPETAKEQPNKSGAGAVSVEDVVPTFTTTEKSTMNIMEAIQKLVPGLTDEQYAQIAAVLGLAGVAEEAAMEVAEDAAPAEETMSSAPEVNPLRNVNISELAAAIKTVVDAGPKKAAAVRPTYDFKPARVADEEDDGKKTFNALYVMQYGNEGDAEKAVMRDLVGQDYRQTIHDQNVAFAKYLRRGDWGISGDERKLLNRQIFPADAIKSMLAEGMDVSSIKTTMVEAQGTLGGVAVPPNVQSNITTRLPGLTAVRGLGANVVTLTNSNSVEIPRYTGGDNRYAGNIRGQWGTETQAPTEQNATLDMVTVVAHVYTYKIPLSQSLVEDAANLVSLVQRDIADTISIDEDDAFLVGDGVGKPRGILPAGSNKDSLTEVVSGAAATLTADGLIGLSDGVADQYLAGSAFVFRQSTGLAIRKLKNGIGDYLFDPVLSGQIRTLLGYQYRRTEAMPAVGGNTYPIIFGQMSGYTIVERAGMTIVRFQDSNTGINKVEYQVRRRIGGRVERPWMFAVQKVAAA